MSISKRGAHFKYLFRSLGVHDGGEFGLEPDEQVMNVAVCNDLVGYKTERAGRFGPGFVKADNGHAGNMRLTKFNALPRRWQRHLGDQYVGLFEFVYRVDVDIGRFVGQKELMCCCELGFFDWPVKLISIVIGARVGNVYIHLYLVELL